MRRARFAIGFQARVAALICVACLCAGLAATARAQETQPDPAPSAASKAKAKRAKPAVSGPQPANAAAPAAKDPAVALAAYTSGVKSYQADKFDLAVQSLNGAVQNGGLPTNLLAKALYYRGAAYQRLGKPGQAISDLTSALWFKTGLDDAERTQATALRANAYKDAGLSDQGQSLPGQQTADAAAPGAAKPTAAPRLGLNADATTPAAPASGLGGIGELFGNLFGGGSANPSAATAPPAVASTTVAESPTVWTGSRTAWRHLRKRSAACAPASELYVWTSSSNRKRGRRPGGVPAPKI